jgi:hypothetical protein
VGRVSGWRKCDTCRKVRTTEEFDGASPTCEACRTAPVRTRKAAAPVTTTRTPRAARAPAPERPADAPRRPLLGTVGAGDTEVRERRAKRAAHDALAALHPEEFALLLRDARQAEGLRPAAVPTPAPADEPSPAQVEQSD